MTVENAPRKHRKTISLDFDGVIHSYSSGWVEIDVARDPPVPGAAQFLHNAAQLYQLQVFSSRSIALAGRQCMRNYCIEMMHEYFKTFDATAPHDVAASWVYNNLLFPNEKGPVWLSIDDRAFHFEGEWPSFDFIDNFKPWNKR